MNEASGWAGAFVLAAINIVLFAAAWGRLEARDTANRERQDERHSENQARQREHTLVLRDMDTKIDQINGTVGRHDVRLDMLERKPRD